MRLDHLLSKEFLLFAPGRIGRASEGELNPVEALTSVLELLTSATAYRLRHGQSPRTILSSALRERLTGPVRPGRCRALAAVARIEQAAARTLLAVTAPGLVRPLRTA